MLGTTPIFKPTSNIPQARKITKSVAHDDTALSRIEFLAALKLLSKILQSPPLGRIARSIELVNKVETEKERQRLRYSQVEKGNMRRNQRKNSDAGQEPALSSGTAKSSAAVGVGSGLQAARKRAGMSSPSGTGQRLARGKTGRLSSRMMWMRQMIVRAKWGIRRPTEDLAKLCPANLDCACIALDHHLKVIDTVQKAKAVANNSSLRALHVSAGLQRVVRESLNALDEFHGGGGSGGHRRGDGDSKGLTMTRKAHDVEEEEKLKADKRNRESLASWITRRPKVQVPHYDSYDEKDGQGFVIDLDDVPAHWHCLVFCLNGYGKDTLSLAGYVTSEAFQQDVCKSVHVDVPPKITASSGQSTVLTRSGQHQTVSLRPSLCFGLYISFYPGLSLSHLALSLTPPPPPPPLYSRTRAYTPGRLHPRHSPSRRAQD